MRTRPALPSKIRTHRKHRIVFISSAKPVFNLCLPDPPPEVFVCLRRAGPAPEGDRHADASLRLPQQSGHEQRQQQPHRSDAGAVPLLAVGQQVHTFTPYRLFSSRCPSDSSVPHLCRLSVSPRPACPISTATCLTCSRRSSPPCRAPLQSPPPTVPGEVRHTHTHANTHQIYILAGKSPHSGAVDVFYVNHLSAPHPVDTAASCRGRQTAEGDFSVNTVFLPFGITVTSKDWQLIASSTEINLRPVSQTRPRLHHGGCWPGFAVGAASHAQMFDSRFARQ